MWDLIKKGAGWIFKELLAPAAGPAAAYGVARMLRGGDDAQRKRRRMQMDEMMEVMRRIDDYNEPRRRQRQKEAVDFVSRTFDQHVRPSRIPASMIRDQDLRDRLGLGQARSSQRKAVGAVRNANYGLN